MINAVDHVIRSEQMCRISQSTVRFVSHAFPISWHEINCPHRNGTICTILFDHRHEFKGDVCRYFGLYGDE